MDSLPKEIIRFSYNELCPTNEIGGSGCRSGCSWLRHALVIAIIFQQQTDSEHGVNYLFIFTNVGPMWWTFPNKEREWTGVTIFVLNEPPVLPAERAEASLSPPTSRH